MIPHGEWRHDKDRQHRLPHVRHYGSQWHWTPEEVVGVFAETWMKSSFYLICCVNLLGINNVLSYPIFKTNKQMLLLA